MFTSNCQYEDYKPFTLLSGSLRISETGQIGCFIEVVLVSKEKKAGKLGGKKNW